MKYLTKHETEAAYEAAKDNLALPNVALTLDDNQVHYQPLVPTPSHEYVDLGLPSGTKWATMNIGANSITDYGNYYQYGKGSAQHAATSGDSKYTGTENPLATSADTAAQVWGGDWHMPTSTQFEELTANTTYEWVTNYQGSGVNGATFTANGQTLFFPAAGYCRDSDGSLVMVGVRSAFWSSTPLNEGSANDFFFFNSGKGVSGHDRNFGYPVRAVVG